MITVQLQEADYLAALRLHRRHSAQMLWTMGSVGCYIVGGLLLFMFASPDEIDLVYILFGVAAFLVVFMVWMQFAGVPMGARRRFKQQKDLNRQYTITWNDEKLVIDGDDVHVGILWTDFLKWRQDKGLFVIYSSRMTFRMVPKRVFADQTAVTAFEQLLRDKIGPEGVVRK